MNWKCPACGEITTHETWKDPGLYCEYYGSHTGLQYPVCKEVFDGMWDKEKLEAMRRGVL